MNSTFLRGLALIAIAALLWGTTGTAQSFASPALSSLWIGTFRLLTAAVFFGVWWAMVVGPGRRKMAGTGSRELPWWAVLGAALAMCVYNLAFFAGVRSSSVGIGTAIALGSAPVWAGLLQTLLERRLPPRPWWLGVALAVLGLALASGIARSAATSPMTGVALCALAGLSYALYARCTKAFAAHPSIVAVTGTVFALAALMAAPFAWWSAGAPVMALADIAPVLWLGVAGTGVAYLLFALGLRYVSSATAVALGMLEPVAAVGFAITIVGERPDALARAGLLIVLAGLVVLVRAELAQRYR